MRITAGGNLLIGTNTDNGAKLQVNGVATIAQKLQVTGSTSPSSGSGLEIFYDGSYAGILGFNRTSPGYLPIAIDGSSVTLFTSSTPRLTINSSGDATFSGKVAIGNTVSTAVSVMSTHKVEIVINGTTYYLLATT
jgi:hypothetical protein